MALCTQELVRRAKLCLSISRLNPETVLAPYCKLDIVKVAFATGYFSFAGARYLARLITIVKSLDLGAFSLGL